MEFSGWNAVPAPAVVEHPAPEGPTQKELEAGDAFEAHLEARLRAKEIVAEYRDDPTLQPVEIGIINTLEEALATDNVEKLNGALRDWKVLREHDEDEDRVDEEQAHVAQLIQEEKEAEKAKKEEAKRLFVESNRKFQIQKGIFKTKGRCAELREAQVAYIKTRDELSAVMAEIKDPAFTLRAMADERWPDENHDDFEEKLRVIYNSIKSNLNFKAKKGKPVAVEKRAPAHTLEEMVSASLRKAAGSGE